MSDEPELHHVALWLCQACLDGKGGECHTPGCALWMSRAPDIPFRDRCENLTERWGVRYTIRREPTMDDSSPDQTVVMESHGEIAYEHASRCVTMGLPLSGSDHELVGRYVTDWQGVTDG